MIKKGRENKPHIGIFGRRNNGKSSFINTLAGQEIAIVSDTAGTTTDPVKKSVEIFGVGPAILIDTAGIDDTGSLGSLRIRKTLETIKIIDLAIVLIAGNSIGRFEQMLVDEFNKFNVPYFFVHNKSDQEALEPATKLQIETEYGTDIVSFTSAAGQSTEAMIEMMRKHIPPGAYNHTSILAPILKKGDHVLLITPIDLEAPEGRMILPQVQAIRDVLDNDCIAIVLRETAVKDYLASASVKPALAITDSQVIGEIEKIVPPDIPLTGFSIMLAHYKGNFGKYVEGTPQIANLKDGDRVLILESCTHQVNCDDIGRYKIPDWMRKFTGKDLSFDVVSGLSKLPEDLGQYALALQCGGCMITRKQIESRLRPLIEKGIPVTNYGMAIAFMKGIYHRSVQPFVVS